MDLIPLKETPEEIMSQLIEKLKKQFGEHLLLVGAKGSLARNDFTPYSDFDLVVIVDEEKKTWHEFMYNSTYLDIQIISLDNVLKIINTITIDWPSNAGGKLNIKVFYDKDNIQKQLQDEYQKVIQNKKAFEQAINLNTVTEYYSKAIRYYENKEYDNLRWACLWLFEEFSMIFALLNQRYFTIQGPTAKIKEMKTFEYQPEGWKEKCENLVGKDPEKNITGAKELFSLLHEMSKKHDFANHHIDAIDEIQFKK